MIKKILIFTIIILVLMAIAIGVQLYLDRNENPSVVEDNTERRGGIFGFLGFGNEDTQVEIDEGEPFIESEPRPTFIPTLREISETPVAGATFVGTTTIRYVDRGNGHIYDVSVDAYDQEKISNTTIPKVYKADWLANGESVIFQQLEGSTIKTRLIGLLENNSTTTTDNIREVSISFLPDNIEDIEVSPTNNIFAYLQNNNSATNSTITISGGTSESSFSIPGREWILDWINSNTISLTTKASSNSLGYNYKSNLSGSLEKNLGDIEGLTTKSNTSWILYSDSSLNLESLNLQTSTSTDTGLTTLAEKCAFVIESEIICGSPQNISFSNQYPDDWYMGLVSFNDVFVRYNLETGLLETIYTPQEGMDVIEPQISNDGNYLLFVNKKDLSLWVLNLEEASSSGNSF